MNPLPLDDANFVLADRTVLHDCHLKYPYEAHRAENGDTPQVGRLGSWMGEDCLLKLDTNEMTLEMRSNQPPPAKLPITPLLALLRPRVLRRMLQTVAVMGVPKLVLLNSYRVEKGFWRTPLLDPTVIRENLVLGLKQTCDTVLPEIIVKKRFKPFVKDRPPALIAGNLGLVGHLDPWPACPHMVEKPVTLAIGPEGGWIPYEADRLRETKLHPMQLGERILCVEATVSALLTRLF